MRLSKTVAVVAAAAAVAISAASFNAARAADPAPAANGPTTQPTQRSIEQIVADLQGLESEIGPVVSPVTLGDATRRAQKRDEALTVLRRVSGLLDEMAGTPQGARMAAQAKTQITPLLLVYGDEATEKSVNATADSKGPDALTAKFELIFARWVCAAGKPADQTKVTDDAIALANENKSSDVATAMLSNMGQFGDSSPDNVKRLRDQVINNMTSPLAAQQKASIQDAQTLAGLENKPLVIAGLTKDGSNLTTADWKGKVILVDFWASWCGPCKEEAPRVEKMYGDYHVKGLEVLGVSCDYTAAALDKYLKENPAMAWPQLFDPNTKPAGWHALARQFGIDGIPTMFLIDRKGVVRTVKARENMETLIPQLLAESGQ